MTMRVAWVFFTVEEISTPRSNVVQAIKNAWWPTTVDGKVCVYTRGRDESAQANGNRDIADKVRTSPELTGPVVQIPLAFIVHRC